MKYSQRQLLEGGMWDKFKKPMGGVGRALNAGWTVGKEIAKTVAPEITNPIGATVKWGEEFAKKVGQSGRSLDDRTIQFLLKKSLFPLPDNFDIKNPRNINPNDAKINWMKDRDEPNIQIGSVRVGKSDIVTDSKGNNPKPILIGTWQSEGGANIATVIYDNNTKQISLGKSPYSRNLKPTQLNKSNPKQGQTPPIP